MDRDIGDDTVKPLWNSSTRESCLSMCRSAANIIKVEGTIITFEGGDRADFGQVAEGCVRRAKADVKEQLAHFFDVRKLLFT